MADERKAEEKRREPTIESGEVGDWLQTLGLEQYYDSFLAAGYTRLHYVALMTKEDFPRVKVLLPGHKKVKLN